MLLWWLQVALPITASVALLGLFCWHVLLRLREITPSGSLVRLIMSILGKLTDANKLKGRLADLASKPDVEAHNSLKQLEEALNEHIFGQSHIIKDIVATISSAALRERRNRPVASYMIAGPSGTGKSMLGKVLGQLHFGKNGYVLFDMATANNAHNANAVFGVPMGYQGGDRPSHSIAHLITYPRSVVVVDEFEKTTTEVQQRFLEALQDGVLTNVSSGLKVDVTQAIFVFTTNARQEQCAKAGANQQASVREISAECKTILNDVFGTAIMQRIDRVFAFQPLDDFAKCELVAAKIVGLVNEYPMELVSIDPEVLAQWVQRYNREEVNGRDIKGHVEDALSSQVDALKLQGVQRIKVVSKKQQPVVEKA